MKKLATALLTAALSLASAQTVVSYGTWDATREKADRALIAAYEAANPGVKVQYNLVPWDTYWQKASAMAAGGVTFDLMWMDLDNFPFFASQGALAQIPITAAERAVYPAASLAPYLAGGQDKTYGLPLGPQAVSVFINRSLFRERGVPIPTSSWTWDQMVAAAQRLTFSRDGKRVWGINGADIQPDLEYGMSFYYTFGGRGIIAKTAGGYAPNLDASFRDTAQRLHDLIYRYKVSPTARDTAQAGYQLFQAGQLGIYVEGTWMTSVWAENPRLDWAFAPFPTLRAGERPRPVYSAHALVIPSASRQKAAAAALARWLTQSQAASRLLAQNGLLPTRPQPYQALFRQALPNRNAGVILGQLETSVIRFSDLRSVSNLPEVLNELHTALNLAWTGNKPLAAALEQGQSQMGRLLREAKELRY